MGVQPFEEDATSTADNFLSLLKDPSDFKGVRTIIVKRSLFWITGCRPVDEPTSASLSFKHPLRQIATRQIGSRPIAFRQIAAFYVRNEPINSEKVAAVHRYEPLYPQSSLEDLHLWILMEFTVCQKMLHVVVENCGSLQTAGLAGDYISALVLEPLVPTDRNNVVKLKRLVIEDLLNVAVSFADIAPEIYDAWSRHRLHNAEFSLIQERFNTIIGNLELWDDDALTSLVSISLQQGRAPNKTVIENHTAYFSTWRGIIELLDLIVISYAYVHFDDISEEWSYIKDHRISLPTESFRWPGSPDSLPRLGPVQLRMLPLNCLARFLGDRDVLVFERASGGSPRSALYLSTDIKTFADVWGPVWQVHDPKYPGVIAKYNSGGGSIVPWKHDPTKHPRIRDDERLCHWIDGFEDMSSEIEDLMDGKLGFVQNAQLLIGAGTNQQLKWRRCRCSVDVMTQHLKDYNRLGFLMTSEGYRKVVSYQTSLVLGSHGAQFGINRTVEDKKGTPLKISILERWENDPSSRKPQKFQNYWSVAISLCNMNAERVRLVRVLGSESVLALLGNFDWSDLDGHNSDGVRESYIFASYKKAVRNEDPKALGHLWDSNPAWRKDIGDAILVCLRVLARTGYREEYNQFYALWLPRNCSEPRRVILELKDQNWIPFLKDTTNTMTTAVIVEDSFGRCSKDKKPSSWFKEPSVLETAICVNQSISPHGDLRKCRSQPREGRQIQMLAAKHDIVWSSMWDVTQLPEKTSFKMNTQVRVRVQRQIGRWQLLLEVESSMMSNLSRKIRGSNQPSHWEYTDEEGETSDCQPIPVAIKGGIPWTSMLQDFW